MRRFAFVGVPFDGAATLGWPGARYAPDEVRRHLAWMQMRVEDGSIYWIDRDEIIVFDPDALHDAGDVPVVPHDLMATIAATRQAVATQAGEGTVPLVVGGDDSVLFPAVAGVHDAVAGSVGVVHFDAHLDLLDRSPAQGTHSQSSGMRRSLELDRVDATHCVQVGTRNFNFPSSKRFIDEMGLTEIPAAMVHERGASWTVQRVLDVIEPADHVVVSVDIDVLDPAHAPGVGWQEPGGLTTRQLLDVLLPLAGRADGFALNEVNPMTDAGQQTTILAANLVFQFVVAAQL
jgi:formiminoglutamase/agmatinase